MLVHEVPHEVGDFAILLQNGFSRRAAILAQLCTAVGAFAGCACGLAGARASAAAEEWLVSFTSGGFVYVANVTDGHVLEMSVSDAWDMATLAAAHLSSKF